MKTKSLKPALLTFSAVFLLVVLALSLAGTASATWKPDLDNIVLRGSENAYTTEQGDGPPIMSYEKGDRPPLAALDKIGSGAVLATSIGGTCRGSPSYGDARWKKGEWDVFLDKSFQAMVSGAEKVLWYEGYNVYHNYSICSYLIDNLEANFGYDVTPDATEPIADINLDSYDILVLPALQLGSSPGDPSQLPDSDVSAIENFVEDGGGLLIMNASDFFPHFPEVQNKILKGIGFYPLSGGRYLGFQSDSIYDDIHNAGETYLPLAYVDTATGIGSAYESETGSTTIETYSIASMAPIGPGVAMYVIPSYEENMPGTELSYRVRVLNSGTTDLTVDLEVTDNAGWNPTLDKTSLSLAEGENETALLKVTVPDNASFSAEDKMTVTATGHATGYADVSASKSCVAHAAMRLPVYEDAYVDDSEPSVNYGDEYYLNIGRYQQNWQYGYLKFNNLDEIPSDASITGAKLCLWAWSAYGGDQQMEVKGTNNLWTESTINWNNKPEPGSTLDTQLVSSASEMEPVLYTWDVTSYVQDEFEKGKKTSFVVKPVDECPPSTNRRFDASEWWYRWVHPYLRVTFRENVPDVDVSIQSPTSQSGEPGVTLSYTVTVMNTGDFEDTYDLATSGGSGWSPSLSVSSTDSLSPGSSQDVTLSVTVPSSADNGDSTSVTVTAASQENSAVSASGTCTATAEVEGEDGGGLPVVPVVGAVIVIVVVVGVILVIRPF